MMNDVGAFPRLLELLQLQRKGSGDGPGLHRVLMDLLYEMSRIQRVRIEDLGECMMGRWEWVRWADGWCSACG